jgi:hypothetical protein
MLERQERLPDGSWKLAATLDGLGELFQLQLNWELHAFLIDRWRKESPSSSNAAIIDALYWYKYAWEARGGGYASAISAKALEVFRLRLANARRVLEQTKAFAGNNPYWYTLMLGIATGEGWSLDQQIAIFKEATARQPLFDPSYARMMQRLTPRWGGSIEQAQSFVATAVKLTEALEGKTLNARLYSVYAATESNRQPFSDLEIPWPLMKAGFDDLIQSYPSPWNINAYARFACQAGDKTTFLGLLPRLENVYRVYAWPGGYSFEICKATFTQQT